jgi:hypothetical protein
MPIQVFAAEQKEDYTSFNQLFEKGRKNPIQEMASC